MGENVYIVNQAIKNDEKEGGDATFETSDVSHTRFIVLFVVVITGLVIIIGLIFVFCVSCKHLNRKQKTGHIMINAQDEEGMNETEIVEMDGMNDILTEDIVQVK